MMIPREFWKMLTSKFFCIIMLVCTLSYRLSVCHGCFSELAHQFFLISCMKLGKHGWKLMVPKFSGKFSFWLFLGKRAKNCPKMGFIDFWKKLNHEMLPENSIKWKLHIQEILVLKIWTEKLLAYQIPQFLKQQFLMNRLW